MEIFTDDAFALMQETGKKYTGLYDEIKRDLYKMNLTSRTATRSVVPVITKGYTKVIYRI